MSQKEQGTSVKATRNYISHVPPRGLSPNTDTFTSRQPDSPSYKQWLNLKAVQDIIDKDEWETKSRERREEETASVSIPWGDSDGNSDKEDSELVGFDAASSDTTPSFKSIKKSGSSRSLSSLGEAGGRRRKRTRSRRRRTMKHKTTKKKTCLKRGSVKTRKKHTKKKHTRRVIKKIRVRTKRGGMDPLSRDSSKGSLISKLGEWDIEDNAELKDINDFIYEHVFYIPYQLDDKKKYSSKLLNDKINKLDPNDLYRRIESIQEMTTNLYAMTPGEINRQNDVLLSLTHILATVPDTRAETPIEEYL